jgi:hypothetical protein
MQNAEKDHLPKYVDYILYWEARRCILLFSFIVDHPSISQTKNIFSASAIIPASTISSSIKISVVRQ